MDIHFAAESNRDADALKLEGSHVGRGE